MVALDDLLPWGVALLAYLRVEPWLTFLLVTAIVLGSQRDGNR